MRSISGLIDIFISPSQFLRNRFIEFGIAKEKCLFIPHGVRAFEVKNGHPKVKNEVTFGFIGTLLPAKGTHLLIEAFRGIKSENTRLNIYGKLYPYLGFEDYPAYLKRLARGKRIYFKGEFDNEELGRIFSEIDVLVVPSLWMENSPLVIHEAFRAKVPVIASRIGGICELVYHGKNGFLFNPTDTEGLKSNMELIIEKPEIIQELKKNISPPRDINNHAAEIEDVYVRIIKTVRSS
jgi:glycosyltransferase involved in cell wall biosynthesis